MVPDAMFFTRTVPVAADATSAQVAAQVELALETLSPFPVAQLYHGHYWKPGLAHAFVFAAYRRRFTAEQTASWAGAELVVPIFATVFGAEVAPATTIVLSTAEGFTAVHWETAAIPARVIFHPLLPEATEADRLQARDELLRAAGGTRKVVDVAAPLEIDDSGNDDEFVFRAGDFNSRLPASIASALDVRDKAQLAELRRVQLRDLWLWRTALGSAALIALLAVGEVALWAGNTLWQQPRLAKLKAQAPVVEKIDNAQKLTNRIEELTTRRLLPLEMIEVARQKPDSIQWLRVTTNGLDTLIIEAQTNNTGEINVYKAALRNLPQCEKVETEREQIGANGMTTFTLTIGFKPGTLKPETPAA